MKKWFCFILFICFSFIGFSQLETYKLDSYTQPDFYRKVSSISPSVSFFKSQEVYGTLDTINNLNSTAALDYSLYITKYTQKTQTNLSFGQSPRYRYNKNSDIKDTYYEYDYGLALNQKYFLTDHLFFAGFEVQHYAAISKSKREVINTATYYTDSEAESKYTNNELQLKIGKGRIEFVNHAFHAIQILNALCEHSTIEKEEISHDQIETLANKLGELRNIRIPDARLENNQEIELLFTYLENTGLIEKDNYHLITKILDAYQYELFINRRKGMEWSVGLGVNGDFRINELDYLVNGEISQNNSTSELGPFVELEFNYFKPLSHKWQLNLTNSFVVSQLKMKEYEDFGDSENLSRDNRFTISGMSQNTYLTLYYILNRRTYLDLDLISNFSFQESTEDLSTPIKTHRLTASLGFDYYFTPWHTININLGVYYSKGTPELDTKNINTSASITTNYFFH